MHDRAALLRSNIENHIARLSRQDVFVREQLLTTFIVVVHDRVYFVRQSMLKERTRDHGFVSFFFLINKTRREN